MKFTSMPVLIPSVIALVMLIIAVLLMLNANALPPLQNNISQSINQNVSRETLSSYTERYANDTKYVWVDGWFNCRGVATDNLGYYPDTRIWMKLTTDQQLQLRKTCHGS